MPAIAFLLFIEILIFLALKEHFKYSSKPVFYISLSVNFILSAWIWFLVIRIISYKGYFDMPVNVSNRMNLMGMIGGVVFPRFLLILLHYSGKLIRLRKRGHIKWLTRAGITISFVIMTAVGLGSFAGRFNVKTEEVTIKIKSLPMQLDGLKIVHLSDMHLASFHRHYNFLQSLMERVNSYKPDLIINTGDFVSYGWREFNGCDTILGKAGGKYGNFAILGNHDMGTYLPDTAVEKKEAIIEKNSRLVVSSGYHLLYHDNHTIDINGAKLNLTGVKTAGRFPRMIYGNLSEAMENADSSDFRILLLHDPNQWEKDVARKTDIMLTLAGHTHGMQMGIMTKKLKWSPAKWIFPRWGGLYCVNGQYLYVNRGLGVLAIPFRIWMPPEITVLILHAE